MNVKKWLTEEERKDYDAAVEFQMEGITETYDKLAACRALLKKHEWVFYDATMCWVCLECGAWYKEKTDDMPHKPDCAWDAALKPKT